MTNTCWLVAVDSSIHLKRALAGVTLIYCELTPQDNLDYYGYVRHGLMKGRFMVNQQLKQILVLSNATSAKSFADHGDEFLQSRAYERVCTLLRNNLNDARALSSVVSQDTTDFYAERGHYSILVNGQRGSGKTTFALTALKKLEKEGLTSNENQSDRFINLGILDPTLIDSKEHVLLAVISKIKQKVDNHFRHQLPQEKYPRSSTSGIFANLSHPQDEWRHQLKDLAKGLQQLDGIGKDAMQDTIWEDPVTIMEEGLVAISAGLNLNQQIHRFIDDSLKLLGAKAFALALDDIDTFFEKGWPVLEALRKYLTTPKLVTLVCGDLQLYQAQVKKHQWHQLGDLATKFELGEQANKHHQEMVRQLTEQYLLKVLPGDRRVELITVQELGSISVRSQKGELSKPGQMKTLDGRLMEVLNASFKVAAGTPEASLFLTFIKKKPLRLVIQLLQKLENNLITLPQMEGLFSSWVYEQGASKLLQNNDSETMLIQQLLNILEATGLMQADLELLPKYSQTEQNTGAFICNRILCDYFAAQPGKALDFMLRAGLVRQALYFEGFQGPKQRPVARTIMAVMGGNNNEDVLTVARQWCAAVVHGLNGGKQPNQLGTIQVLSGGSITRNRPQGLKNLYRTTSRELVRAYAEAENEIQLVSTYSSCALLAKGLAFINSYHKKRRTPERSQRFAISPQEAQEICRNVCASELGDLLGCLFVNVSHDGQNYYRASSFNIISLVPELLSLAEKTNADDELSETVAQLLARAGQIRTYSVPVDFSLHEVQNKPEDEDESPEVEEDGTGEYSEKAREKPHHRQALSLVHQLSTWLRKWKKSDYEEDFSGLKYPPFVWSRIWQRFYYTLGQQDKNFKPNQRFLGEMLHRQLVAFLNAVLVEEQRYLAGYDSKALKGRPVLILDNPVNSDDNYIKNLKNLVESQVSAPLFIQLAGCPIFYPLLNTDHYAELNEILSKHAKSQAWSSLRALVSNEEEAFLKLDERTGLYDLLNLVPPARSSEQAIPTLWRHEVLGEYVLKNEKVFDVLRALFSDPKKNHKGLVVEHLARTTNLKTDEIIKSLLAGPE